MPTRRLHPLVWTFVKLTALVAVALFIFWALSGLIHILLLAAIVAAVILGGLFLYNLFRRYRARLPVLK